MLYFLALAYLLVASYTDVKTRMVSDGLTFSALFLGVVLNAFFFGFEGFFSSVAGAALFFCLGYLLFRAGVWAGGDVKLFSALGAIVPKSPSVEPFFAFSRVFSNYPVFPFLVFFNSLLVMMPYLLLYLVALVAKRGLYDDLKKESEKAFYKSLDFGFRLVSVTIISFAFSLELSLSSSYLVLPLLLFFSLFRYKRLLAVPVLINFLFDPWPTIRLFLVEWLVVFSFALFFGVLMYSRKNVLVKKVKITGLREGDIVGETIRVVGKKAVRDSRGVFEHLLALARGEFLAGEVVADRFNASGLEKEDIKRLKSLVRGKRLKNEILVKESAPMVPAFFVGLVFSLLVGDLFWFLWGGL